MRARRSAGATNHAAPPSAIATSTHGPTLGEIRANSGGTFPPNATFAEGIVCETTETPSRTAAVITYGGRWSTDASAPRLVGWSGASDADLLTCPCPPVGGPTRARWPPNELTLERLEPA